MTDLPTVLGNRLVLRLGNNPALGQPEMTHRARPLMFTEDERFNYLVLKKKKPLNPLEHRLSQSRCGRAAFPG